MAAKWMSADVTGITVATAACKRAKALRTPRSQALGADIIVVGTSQRVLLIYSRKSQAGHQRRRRHPRASGPGPLDLFTIASGKDGSKGLR